MDEQQLVLLPAGVFWREGEGMVQREGPGLPPRGAVLMGAIPEKARGH